MGIGPLADGASLGFLTILSGLVAAGFSLRFSRTLKGAATLGRDILIPAGREFMPSGSSLIEYNLFNSRYQVEITGDSHDAMPADCACSGGGVAGGSKLLDAACGPG